MSKAEIDSAAIPHQRRNDFCFALVNHYIDDRGYTAITVEDSGQYSLITRFKS
jgi:hypothetical protein